MSNTFKTVLTTLLLAMFIDLSAQKPRIAFNILTVEVVFTRPLLFDEEDSLERAWIDTLQQRMSTTFQAAIDTFAQDSSVEISSVTGIWGYDISYSEQDTTVIKSYCDSHYKKFTILFDRFINTRPLTEPRLKECYISLSCSDISLQKMYSSEASNPFGE